MAEDREPPGLRSGKALPSPLSSLHFLVERAVTVANLVTAPLWTVPPDQPAEEAAATLSGWVFDVAGLGTDPITHFVRHDDLEKGNGTAGSLAQPILASETVEKAMPLA